jgi:phytoene dehydrogenase-like protein
VSAAADVIVIGAGPNGLTAAGLLARRGRKVLVLERSGFIGGLASGEEFHPGYRSPGLLHDSSRVRETVIRELDLGSHGLRMRDAGAGILALGDGSASLYLDGDRELAREEIARHSESDAKAWGEYHAFLDRIRGVLGAYLTSPPINFVDPESMGLVDLIRRALKVRSLGRTDMMDLLRLPPMCVADWVEEWFETNLLRVLVAWPALSGAWMGPRSPGSNGNLLFHEALRGKGVVGNGPALVQALAASVRASGVEIRTGAEVREILAGDARVEGVLLADGSEVISGIIASSCDPVTTTGLLAPGVLATRSVGRMESYRMRGITGQVLLALEGFPGYKARPGVRVEYARTGGRLDELERAFDPVKYRRIPSHPVVEFHLSGEGPGSTAPAGGVVVSALVSFLPADPEGGWTREMREAIGEQVTGILEEHAPGVRSRVVGRKVLAPPDITDVYGVHGGHIHHGEHALDQLLIRPIPECHAWATPLPGLFLCGMGTHPGGGLTCAPGELAAAAILAAGR